MGKLKLVAIIVSMFMGLAVVLPSSLAVAASPADQAQSGLDAIGGSKANSGSSLPSLIHTGINVLLFLAGALAVVMITYAGIQYVTSHGDASSVTSAKNTILYAVAGLVVTIMAYAIVNFVVTRLQQPAPTKAVYVVPASSQTA